ncbi:hypothetical protein [Pedococcus sp. 5OH_020]|uniref:hypothetical protein n=1 Tax=Pedococcus sp. 5OH_020 TaxID=2989814 RepID=UPI0022E9F742|nr:hypothetical protein [Pedococcus sp. 5OH_020]
MSRNVMVVGGIREKAASWAFGRRLAGSGGGRNRPGVSSAVGGFYLCMAGINAGLAIADAEIYRHFADGGLFGFVRAGWADVVMANPVLWAALLATGEGCIGVVLLAGGKPARWAWVAVLAFHALLLLFGWGFWLYAVPALAVFALLARHDWHQLG